MKKNQRNNGYRYALVGIDNFTKFAHAVPMLDKKEIDIIPAFKEILDIIGVPKQIYSDNEGGFTGKDFIKLLNEKKIKHIITPFAQGVERFNRTLKNMTVLKLKALNKEEQFKWVDALQDTLNKYNNQEHSTIKMTPNEAKKRGNRDVVYFNMWDRARRDRAYPQLKVGDMVRTKEKKKTGRKDYEDKWSRETYKITYIKGDDYLINDINRKRVFLRHELLKVN